MAAFIVASLLRRSGLIESWHPINAFTVVADPMLGYAAITFTLLALLVATWAAWRAYFRINRLMECLEIGAKPAPPESAREVETVCRRYGIADR
jgi:hypothetical protein